MNVIVIIIDDVCDSEREKQREDPPPLDLNSSGTCASRGFMWLKAS